MNIYVRGRPAQAGQLILSCSLAVLLVLCACSPAIAQQFNLNNSDILTTPRQLDQFDKNRPQKTDDLIPKKDEDDSKPEVNTSDVESSTEAGDKDEGPKFMLQEIVINGVTVLTAEELTEKFAPWIGKEVTFNDLLKIAGDITTIYKEKGYITSRAVVPPQKVENGAVQIIVQEGRIGKINLEGNKFTRDRFILGRVDLKEGDVFRLEALEKDMVRLNDQGVIDRAHATLKRGEEPGTSDIGLEVTDHRPYHLNLSFDNQGRDAVGLYRTSISASHENFLGVGDSIAGNVVLASRTTAVSGQYRYPLTRSGKWGVSGSYLFSKVKIRDEIESFDANGRKTLLEITGKTQRFGVVTDFPILETDDGRWKLTGDTGLYWTDSMVYLNGVEIKHFQKAGSGQKPSFPVVNTISSGLNLNEQDKTGRTVVRAGMTNGIGWMNGNTAFAKWNLDATRIQGGLPYGLLAVGKAQTQFSTGRLPGIEQMQIGGANSVRGYTEGLLSGDVGYLFSGELRVPLHGMPEKIKKNWVGLLFVDHGAVYIAGNDTARGATGKPGYLTSYGVGIRGQINQYLQAQSDMGFVWQYERRSVRAHFKISSQLF